MGLGAGDHNLGIGDDLLAARAQDDAVELCDAQRGAGEEEEEWRALMRASEVAREAGRGMASVPRGEYYRSGRWRQRRQRRPRGRG